MDRALLSRPRIDSRDISVGMLAAPSAFLMPAARSNNGQDVSSPSHAPVRDDVRGPVAPSSTQLPRPTPLALAGLVTSPPALSSAFGIRSIRIPPSQLLWRPPLTPGPAAPFFPSRRPDDSPSRSALSPRSRVRWHPSSGAAHTSGQHYTRILALRMRRGAGHEGGTDMHVWKRVARVVGSVVGFVVRRGRLTVTVVVALLLVGPLALTRDGEVFVLNALGLGIAALIVRRLARIGRSRRRGDR